MGECIESDGGRREFLKKAAVGAAAAWVAPTVLSGAAAAQGSGALVLELFLDEDLGPDTTSTPCNNQDIWLDVDAVPPAVLFFTGELITVLAVEGIGANVVAGSVVPPLPVSSGPGGSSAISLVVDDPGSYQGIRITYRCD